MCRRLAAIAPETTHAYLESGYSAARNVIGGGSREHHIPRVMHPPPALYTPLHHGDFLRRPRLCVRGPVRVERNAVVVNVLTPRSAAFRADRVEGPFVGVQAAPP
jgi:hypothetical protein